MILKKFQQDAVAELLRQFRELVSSSGNDKRLVFKSPTGSGKTVMMGELLHRLAEEEWSQGFIFIWASLYNLHNQSKKKLGNQLSDTSYKILGLEDIEDKSLAENSLLFVNWHSLTTQKKDRESGEQKWSNIYVRETENGRSIASVLEKTRESGLQVILIVDEAHRNYLSERTTHFISDIFKPKLAIEVSATPVWSVSAEEQLSKKAGFVKVEFTDAIDSGLIKTETVINQSISSFVDLANSADDLVVQAAVAKREELCNRYTSSSISVNPLVLIQLPSEQANTSALDVSVREAVETQLANLGITYENGKLAVWLSEEKTNLSLIEKNSSPVEALIFKEAVAVGWDCPRAQILVMLREIGSIVFEIQTVGRVLRMPEAMHYEDPELNKAFVYTNVPSINIKTNSEELNFFKTRYSYFRSELQPIVVPSEYLNRQDYGDLTSSFTQFLVEELNNRFGITVEDTANEALIKADKYLELYSDELKTPILADVIVQNLDGIEEEIGKFDFTAVKADVSPANIEKQFNYLLKSWSLPYSPARSYTKIKRGLYKWFAQFGYSNSKWSDIQRVVACSEVNQKLLAEAINAAKTSFELAKPSGISGRKGLTSSNYSPPKAFSVGDNYESVSLSKYGYEPAYLRIDRSEPERNFERLVDSSSSVEWWIKNGEGQNQFLSIVYEYFDTLTQKTRKANFFPDYIVKFLDGSIGIYETKSGLLIHDYITQAKSDALQSYLKINSELKMQGGIVNSTPSGQKIFRRSKYTADQSQWERLEF